MLVLEKVTKRFGGLTAVNGVTATFAAGSITAIIGPNGAGKTTLFAMIAGATQPTSGRIVFNGRDLTGQRADVVCRAGIGRTFQVVKPFWQLSVRDHLRAAALFGSAGDRPAKAGSHGYSAGTHGGNSDPDTRGFRRQPEDRTVDDVLALTNLTDRAEEPARNLTLADCRRLEIARALATGARLILLDETMAGLTAEETRDAIDLVKRVRDSGRTVILIEHVLPAVTGLAERALVLDRGTVIADGSPRDVFASAAVKKAYLGEEN
jgi:branched-chain amino acid transport system ATP-binding protein